MVFGNHLKYNPTGILNPTVLHAEVPIAKIEIGSHVGISGAIICCETEIAIGDYCLLGAICAIYDTSFHTVNRLERKQNNQVKVKHAPARISDDCWIGANALSLRGITVGPRSIIGANSVVTHDAPAGTIVAGNKARIVGNLDN
jgi:acetyltransferase-like isoleucine patch superfamily enzyme